MQRYSSCLAFFPFYGQCHLQTVIDDTDKWGKENDIVLNRGKCKELIFSYQRNFTFSMYLNEMDWKRVP